MYRDIFEQKKKLLQDMENSHIHSYKATKDIDQFRQSPADGPDKVHEFLFFAPVLEK